MSDDTNYDANNETPQGSGRGKRRHNTQAERDRAQMDKYVNAYERKMRLKSKLETERDRIARTRNAQIAKLDAKIAPYDADLEDLRRRITGFASVTDDHVEDLLDPIDAAYSGFDDISVFSDENTNPQSRDAELIDESNEA